MTQQVNKFPTAPEDQQAGKPGKPARFRQTRFVEHTEQLRLRVGEHQGSIRNWSRTGIGFDLEGRNDLEVGTILEDVRISCGEIPLYDGKVEIRSVVVAPDGSRYYGASFTGSLFLVDGVNAAAQVLEFAESMKSVTGEIEAIDPNVCQSLVAIRIALRRLRVFCRDTERKWRDLSFDSRCEAERILVPHLSRKVTELFTYFNLKVARQIDIDALSNDSIYHRVFAEEASPEFSEGDFPNRAIMKPRGYAGDYEMMNQLYRAGYEGVDLYGRVINYYVANESAGNSVRFRKDFFLQWYEQTLKRPGSVSALSVACGPAVEVQELYKQAKQGDLARLFITLFDLDREALEHAQTKIFEAAIARQVKPQVDFVNASVKSFLADRSEVRQKFDLIYSAGLFDYLDNLTCAALVRQFVAKLNPRGTLVVGNFTKANPTKAFCHLILNWNLIHKSREEIHSWAAGIGGCDFKVDFDPQGINAFLVVTKNAAS